jgi:hypothetical protein
MISAPTPKHLLFPRPSRRFLAAFSGFSTSIYPVTTAQSAAIRPSNRIHGYIRVYEAVDYNTHDEAPGIRHSYPNLSQLALDVLCIPTSSCECERMFSELGDLLEPRRRAIQPQLFAAIQCVRRWRKASLGDDDIAAKAALTDVGLDALYDMSTWDNDCTNNN